MKRMQMILLLVGLVVLGCAMGYCGREMYFNYRLPQFELNEATQCGCGRPNCGCRNRIHPRNLKEYTYEQMPYFRKFPFFNYYNAPTVLGAGARRIPLDTRRAIPNVLDPIDVSNNSISPTNVFLYNRNRGEPMKVGVLTKVFGNENQVIPLVGIERKENKWEYFAELDGEYLPILRPGRHLDEELASNDEVRIQNLQGVFRTTMYSRYLPTFMPFY